MDYLGCVLQSNGVSTMNIQQRISKGQGIIIDILQILEGIYLGDYHFEAFLLMRNSMFLSVLTHNLEVYNISKKDLKSLESLDFQQIRRAPQLNAKQSPIIMMLKLGIKSVKYVIIKKSLLYLHN